MVVGLHDEYMSLSVAHARSLLAYLGSGVQILGPRGPHLDNGALHALLERVAAEELTPLARRPQRVQLLKLFPMSLKNSLSPHRRV
jgi:hypothetical protein